jgi:hypothetical protein
LIPRTPGCSPAVDHLDVDQVQTLAGQIGNEHVHVDVLVNDIWRYIEEVRETGLHADPNQYR